MAGASRYRIIRRIGQGGMAEVLEAVALGEGGFERRVAIKRLLPGREQDAAFRRMFLDEARIASRLHHAAIVGVLDFGVVDDLPFQVLEFVDGVDARRLARLGAMPLEVALHVCLEVARALEHAHNARSESGEELGIVHRDVNPANILVSWGGDVKLTDFGIAFARERSEKTVAGMAKGTILYMAPEQRLALPVDRRADVFALGCCLHELCAGESPLSKQSMVELAEAQTPGRVDGSLPEDVRAIVTRATEIEAARRFAAAAQMADALGRALARRIDRDGRAVLESWLSRVRAQAAPRAGKLDQLLNVEMILDGEAIDRKFTTRDSHPAPPRRRRLWWLGVPLATAAIAAVLLTRDPASSQPPPPATQREPEPQPQPPPPPSPAPAPAPAPAPGPEPQREAKRRARPEPPADPGSATLAIGGPGAHRAEILVDGRSRGFAPKQLDLSAGTHRIELLLPDGKRLTRTLSLSTRDTPSTPARWTVP